MFHMHMATANMIVGNDEDVTRHIRWTGVHDLASITKSFHLPILVRSLASHYGNSDFSDFSRLDILKIYKAVVVDLVLARFDQKQKTTKVGKHSSSKADFTVDMVDESPVQINFPKDFCGLFQLAHGGEKVRRFKNAKELAQHSPRMVKVVKCGQEFPENVSKGDIIQLNGEISEDGVTYLSIKRNKIGSEPRKMSMKCKGTFETYLDTKHYSLSEIIQLFTLPVVVNPPKKSKQSLNVKSEVLSLINHVGGTLTLQREMASEFIVASTKVQQTGDHTTVVMSKNANIQFEVAEDMSGEKYQSILQSFGSVALKGIPQELFIALHGIPIVACLNNRKHSKSTISTARDNPPPPPPRPIDTIPQVHRPTPQIRDSRSVPGYGKIQAKKKPNVKSHDGLKGKEGIPEARGAVEETPIYERIKTKGPSLPLRRSATLERARQNTEQNSTADNDYYAQMKQRAIIMQGNSIASLSRSLAQSQQQHQKPSPFYPYPGAGQSSTISASRRTTSSKQPAERRDQLEHCPAVRQTHLFRSPSDVHQDMPVRTPFRRSSLNLPSETANVAQSSLDETDEFKVTSPTTSSVPCNPIPSQSRHVPGTTVPSIAIKQCQEEPYVFMDSNIRTVDKSYLHPQDPVHSPTSYMKNRPSSPPPRSYGQTVLPPSSQHHQYHLQTIPTDATASMTRHQFRSKSPVGDGYIKMDLGGHPVCAIDNPPTSTRHSFEFRHTGYVNMSDSRPGEMKLGETWKKSQSLESLTSQRSPSPLVCRISPDLIPPRLPPRPPVRADYQSIKHPTLPRRHVQNLDNVHSTLRIESGKYVHQGSSSTCHKDHAVKSAYGYATVPGRPRRLNQRENQAKSFTPIPRAKKTPPPVPQRSDIFYDDTDFLQHSRNHYDDQYERGAVVEQPIFTSVPMNLRRRAPQPYPDQASLGYPHSSSDEDEYDTLQRWEDTQGPDDVFPPPPSPKYLEEMRRESVSTNVEIHDNLIIDRKRNIPHDVGQLSVSELSQCLRLIKIDSKTIDVLQEEQVDGTLLRHMSEDMIKSLGVSQFQAKKLYLFAHDGWRPTSIYENI